MIAAALGIDKFSPDQESLLIPLRELLLSTYAVPKKKAGRDWILPVTRLQDFHTLGAGYDTKDPVDKWNAPRRASGSFSKDAVITRRDYLLDAAFLVILEGPIETLTAVRNGLKDPHWGIWFGRKCCLPATPLIPEIADTREKVSETLLNRFETLKIADLESYDRYLEKTGVESINQMDSPVNFGSREYQSRPVTHLTPKEN